LFIENCKECLSADIAAFICVKPSFRDVSRSWFVNTWFSPS